MNAGLVVAQVLLGLVAHSTGLLADAGHNLTDVGSLALSMVAVRLALRPPNAERSFGNHRATILAALANAALIAVVTVLIVIGSIDRLGHPEHVLGSWSSSPHGAGHQRSGCPHPARRV
jgi:cobalt-zinc-cadmium efflux system protein